MKRIMKQILFTGLIAIVITASAQAELNVAATIPNLGMLAREIGGSAVNVRVMAPADRDAHYLEARPSMMAALRRADIVISVGSELEIGWLPAAIRGANNPRVQTGRTGYFEATRKVDLIQEDYPADRSMGDVHPAGNPHIYLDPERMVTVGHALAERLGRLDRDNADRFKQNAKAFEEKIMERLPAWKERAEGAPAVLPYHSDADYLIGWLNLENLGQIEPLPGIPPTARHLRSLVSEYEGREGIIWAMDFHPSDPNQYMSRQLGWAFHQLPNSVPENGTVDDYIKMIDAWVESLVDTDG